MVIVESVKIDLKPLKKLKDRSPDGMKSTSRISGQEWSISRRLLGRYTKIVRLHPKQAIRVEISTVNLHDLKITSQRYICLPTQFLD